MRGLHSWGVGGERTTRSPPPRHCSHHAPRDDLHAFLRHFRSSSDACSAAPLSKRVDQLSYAAPRWRFSWFDRRRRDESTSAHLAERDDYIVTHSRLPRSSGI